MQQENNGSGLPLASGVDDLQAPHNTQAEESKVEDDFEILLMPELEESDGTNVNNDESNEQSSAAVPGDGQGASAGAVNDESYVDSNDSQHFSSELVLKPGQLGCKHYLRACQLQCPDPICEGACYTCRFCHDEVMYENQMDIKKNHVINRHAVTHVKCLRCDTLQPKSATCQTCKEAFSNYYCAVCTLYDDKSVEKGIYHCEKCGICKVGGRHTSFHCDVCECCYKLPMKGSHVCVKARLKQSCGVCLEDLQRTRQSVIFLDCNHNIHKTCLNDYIKQSLNCPICRKSLIQPTKLEAHFDQEFASMMMPLEYRNARVNIHCNDCAATSLVPFHILGGKCLQCRSYNTMRAKGKIIFGEDDALAGDQQSSSQAAAGQQSDHQDRADDNHSNHPDEERKD